MTHVRNGFSLAHRAALMVAGARRMLMMIASALVVASLAVVGVGYAGTIEELAVLNFGAGPATLGGLCLFCNIPVFPAAPSALANTAPTVNITGMPLPGGISTLSGASSITVTPEGALAVSSGILSAVMEYAPNANGASGPVLLIAPGALGAAFGNPPASATIDISLPQGIAFVPKKPLMALSESFYVANFTGDSEQKAAKLDVGSVLLLPANAGTSSWTGNILGTIHNTLVCTKVLALTDTALLLPVGVATDAAGNVFVANSGVQATKTTPAEPDTAYVTEYSLTDVTNPALGGCPAPINLVGMGTLHSANGVAVDPAGNIFVSDLVANSLFEFSPTGAVLTQISGRRTTLDSPMGIALSPSGLAAGTDDLYVANSRRGTVLFFPNVNSIGVQNNPPRSIILKGRRTRLTIPSGVAPL